jgi:hypothetical protein
VAANVLSEPLLAGRVTKDHLREVQRQREFPTKVIQWIQAQAQKRIVGAALRSDRPLQIPGWVRLLLRTPIIRDLPARVIAHGVKTVRLDPQLLVTRKSE